MGGRGLTNAIICNPALTAEEVRVCSIIKSFCYSSKPFAGPVRTGLRPKPELPERR